MEVKKGLLFLLMQLLALAKTEPPSSSSAEAAAAAANTRRGSSIHEIKNEEEAGRAREAKQLWPILASYYIGQPGPHGLHHEQPQLVRSQPALESIAIPPPPAILSASAPIYGQYPVHSFRPNQLQQQQPSSQRPIKSGVLPSDMDLNKGQRVGDTIVLIQDEMMMGEPPKGGNETSSSTEDMALMESVNSLIGTLPRHAARENYYDLNEGEVQLDFPFTPGDRYFYDFNDTSSVVSGAGRPPPKPEECCLFVFLDGSAYYFDDFMRKLTGFYRLMYGSVNGHPHYVARNCKNADEYGTSCTYIWYSGYGWVVGVGRYIGQTKGVIYTRDEGECPSSLGGWRYLNQDLQWKDNGNIYVKCAS